MEIIKKVEDIKFIKKYSSYDEYFCIQEYPKIQAVKIIAWFLSIHYVVDYYNPRTNNIISNHVGPSHMLSDNIYKFNYVAINDEQVVFCDTYDDAVKALELMNKKLK